MSSTGATASNPWAVPNAQQTADYLERQKQWIPAAFGGYNGLPPPTPPREPTQVEKQKLVDTEHDWQAALAFGQTPSQYAATMQYGIPRGTGGRSSTILSPGMGIFSSQDLERRRSIFGI